MGQSPTVIPTISVSSRQYELWLALARGVSRGEIAKKAGLSTKTVDQHAVNLYRKIGARNALDAVRLAVTYGLIKPILAAPGSVVVTNPEGKMHKKAPTPAVTGS